MVSAALLRADPAGEAGLKLWLTADSAASVDIDHLNDLSQNGNDADQSNSANQPRRYDNTLNYHSIMRFDGNDFLDVDYTSDLNGQKLSVFIVLKRNGTTTAPCNAPWSTGYEENLMFLKNTYGHKLCIENDEYVYKTGQGTGQDWHSANSNISPSGTYEIFNTITTRKTSSTIKKHMYYQNQQVYSDSDIPFTKNATKPFRLGAGKNASSAAGEFFDGDIAEIVVYDGYKQTKNRIRIATYLALKYGITKGDRYYYSTDKKTVWNKPSYHNDIAGLVRDDTSPLRQRVAKSINPDAIVTMSTDTDFFSDNTKNRPELGPTNYSYLVWGNDDGDAQWHTTSASDGRKLLGREWFVKIKEDDQNPVNLQVDVNDAEFDVEDFNGSLFFVTGSSLTSAKPLKMIDDGGGKWHIENIMLNDGEKFGFAIAPDPPVNQAEMVINEVLFRQKTTGKANEEFIEFYVTKEGTIKDLLVSDQDGHQFRFPDDSVQEGDYVVLYTGDGTNTSGNCSDTHVHCYYMNSTTIWNDDNDDIVLLKPSNTDTTELDGETIFYVPIDYVAYVAYKRSGTSNTDPIPPTTQNPTITWSGVIDARDSSGMAKLRSLSLTPNGVDSNDAQDWEITTTGTAPGPMTIDSNLGNVNGTPFICSDGHDNNGLPEMHITKASIVLDDPVNGTTNPKRIPGATIRYCFTVDNNGSGMAEDVTIHERLTGNGRENLSYEEAAGQVQAATSTCDCAGSMSGATITRSGEDLNISLGTITPDQRGCAYIEMSID